MLSTRSKTACFRQTYAKPKGPFTFVCPAHAEILDYLVGKESPLLGFTAFVSQIEILSAKRHLRSHCMQQKPCFLTLR